MDSSYRPPKLSGLERIARRAGMPPAVLAILLLCVIPEAILIGADLGFWGDRRWRGLAYSYFGFWAGLLRDWRPNYPLQPYAMFATYGFLHGGLVHLAVNMMTLVSLGQPVVARIGQRGFLIIYVASIVGGAVGFAILSRAPQPMVGASGALFGLAGAVLAWEFADRRRRRADMRPVFRAIAILAVLNLVLWWAMDGHLAWETHLGGFLTGVGFAFLFSRRHG